MKVSVNRKPSNEVLNPAWHLNTGTMFIDADDDVGLKVDFGCFVFFDVEGTMTYYRTEEMRDCGGFENVRIVKGEVTVNVEVDE